MQFYFRLLFGKLIWKHFNCSSLEINKCFLKAVVISAPLKTEYWLSPKHLCPQLSGQTGSSALKLAPLVEPKVDMSDCTIKQRVLKEPQCLQALEFWLSYLIYKLPWIADHCESNMHTWACATNSVNCPVSHRQQCGLATLCFLPLDRSNEA